MALKDIYTWMNKHPFLSFFLLLISIFLIFVTGGLIVLFVSVIVFVARIGIALNRAIGKKD
jgi:hypothetical protein